MQVKASGPAANLADALAVFGCFAVVVGAVYWLGSALTLLQEGQKQAVESQKEVREELRAGQKQAREELQAGLQALAAQVGSLRESQLAQRMERMESAAIARNLLGGGGSASRARQAEPP
jgi:predicted metalloprotease